MQLFATTCDVHLEGPSIFAQLTSEQDTPSVFPWLSTGLGKFWKSGNVKLLFSPEAFIGLELSLVREVERVFVDRDKNGKEFRVIEVVKDRDPDVRAKVYAREQAIIDAYPNLDFDFHIVARMNRDLRDVLSGIGKLTFER